MNTKNKTIIAIVGRPNVGKSALFNRIIGRKKAVVFDEPGLTRDRNYAEGEWNNKEFLLVDTGGYEPTATDNFFAEIREQANIAIDEADLILFVVDGKEGLSSIDADVAKIIKKSQKDSILVVNKVDNETIKNSSYDFYQLGFEKIYFVSALHGLGMSDLLDDVANHIPEKTKEEVGEGDRAIKVAIVGKQNVGKSTLLNTIVGTKRVITSEVPGTTRDAIDTEVVIDGKRYVLIDTAGIRRRGKIEVGIEKLIVLSAIINMERSDVVLFLLDSSEEISQQDAHIAGFVFESYKPCIIILNKWDKVEKDNKTYNNFKHDVEEKLKFINYSSFLTVSALTGQRVNRIFKIIDELYTQYTMRITTSEMNAIFEQITKNYPPPAFKGKELKLKYITQVGISPPTFAIFVNNKKLIHFSYIRYLMNQLREKCGFTNIPIKILVREKRK